MAKNIILTEEQKLIIEENWTKLKYVDLVKLVFKDEKLDGRSFEGKAVRDYLGVDRKPISSAYEKKQAIELSEEDKELINNNCRFSTANELARNIFKNQGLTPLSLETRTVLNYVKTLPEEVSGKNYGSDDTGEEYKAPATIRQVIDRVNQYVVTDYDFDKINSQQKKTFEQMISLFRSPRFLQAINAYSSKEKRYIFEGEFTKAIFDKPDLNSDEINLVINLCASYVKMGKLNKHLEMLDERYESILSDPESKLSQTLSEMITAKSRELDACEKNIQGIIKQMNGTRAERNKNKPQANLTVASLIIWWKEEANRKKVIEKEEARKLVMEEEVDRLITMDRVKAEMLGVSRSELING